MKQVFPNMILLDSSMDKYQMPYNIDVAQWTQAELCSRGLDCWPVESVFIKHCPLEVAYYTSVMHYSSFVNPWI